MNYLYVWALKSRLSASLSNIGAFIALCVFVAPIYVSLDMYLPLYHLELARKRG